MTPTLETNSTSGTAKSQQCVVIWTICPSSTVNLQKRISRLSLTLKRSEHTLSWRTKIKIYCRDKSEACMKTTRELLPCTRWSRQLHQKAPKLPKRKVTEPPHTSMITTKLRKRTKELLQKRRDGKQFKMTLEVHSELVPQVALSPKSSLTTMSTKTPKKLLEGIE